MLSQLCSHPVWKETPSAYGLGLLWAGTSDLSGFAIWMQLYIMNKAQHQLLPSYELSSTS